MKNSKLLLRVLCLLIALCTLCATFAACAAEDEEDTGSTAGSEVGGSTPDDEEAPLTDEDGYLLDSIPENLKSRRSFLFSVGRKANRNITEPSLAPTWLETRFTCATWRLRSVWT